MLRSMIEAGARKRLEIERIRAIKQATGLFLTLHGGSGTEDDDFRKAIQAGITIIHINTEIRIAWRRGLERALAEQPEEVTPYKLLAEPLHAIKDLVRARLRLFHPMASGANL
jgi:fructose-bisphosphate aldolase class II